MVISEEQPKFVADQMLGRLAKWLRLLGFDTEYFNDIDDARLIRIAREEQRILLTRDTQLCKTRPVARGEIKAILISDDHLKEQLPRLLSNLDLRKSEGTSQICPKCNAPTRKVSPQNARGMVPSYIQKTHKDFTFCPNCRNFFWKGSHWRRIEADIRRLRNQSQLREKDQR
jgi:uncharacterized protein with PIN domain